MTSLQTDELELLAELRDTVRRFVASNFGDSNVRAMMDSDLGYDAAVWRRMCAELGLAGLAVPEEFGGAGFGVSALAVVQHELGRAVACAPMLSTGVLATSALVLGGDIATCEVLLPLLVEGQKTAAVVLGPGPKSPASDVTLNGDLLTGVREFVIDGASADLLVVVVSDGDGAAIRVVERGAAGLTAEQRFPLDQTRRLATLSFSATPSEHAGHLDRAGLERLLSIASTALAAESTGATEHAMEISVQYARERVQFGRAIGSFQAVKHRCADMLVDSESSRSAVTEAAAALDSSRADADLYASLAKTWTSEAFLRVAEAMLQVHGGIGFTWEHSTHLYLKRARANYVLFGTPSQHRDRLGRLLGI